MKFSFTKVAAAVAMALGAQAALAIDNPSNGTTSGPNGSLFVTVFDTVKSNSLVQVLQTPSFASNSPLNYQEFTETLATPDAGLNLTFNVDLSFFTNNGSSLSNLRYTVFAGDSSGGNSAAGSSTQGILVTAEAGLSTIPMTTNEITQINNAANSLANSFPVGTTLGTGVNGATGYYGGETWGDDFASQFDILGSGVIGSSLGFYQALRNGSGGTTPAVVTQYANANGIATWNLGTNGVLTYNVPAPSGVPLPAAVWLLLSGVGGLGVFGRRSKTAVATA
jgi:hypothetical protein